MKDLRDYLALAARHGVTDKVFVVGERGAYTTPGNQRGIYDDRITIVGPQGFWSFRANTDPSIRRQGIAVLKPGQHPYRRGNHGLSKPGGGYPAFRPATPGEKLPVWRDVIQGGKQVGSTDGEGVAINIHRGAMNSTSSEGCQTIQPSDWERFYSTLDRELTAAKQQVFFYLLEADKA